jgi:hypothetical protein
MFRSAKQKYDEKRRVTLSVAYLSGFWLLFAHRGIFWLFIAALDHFAIVYILQRQLNAKPSSSRIQERERTKKKVRGEKRRRAKERNGQP